MISSPVKRGAPFLPSASTVRKLPSVVEAQNDNDGEECATDRGESEIIKKNHHVPITDSCMKRKLTREEENLNIESCDNVIEICNTTGANPSTENRKSLTSLNDANNKLLEIIKNLGKGELFEDPDFPAKPESLFYR